MATGPCQGIMKSIATTEIWPSCQPSAVVIGGKNGAEALFMRIRPFSVGLLSFSKGTFLMVDFKKLRAESAKSKPIDPLEIFRRQPKPPEINDLYTSQAEVLREWNNRRDQQDIVVKLHTGGGKTLVGLLIAQSTINGTN